MQYITNCALLIKGDRVPKGQTIDLEPEFAATLGSDLTPLGESHQAEAEVEEEKPIEEMSLAELKEKAKSLELSTAGSKADLVDRITLHQAEAED